MPCAARYLLLLAYSVVIRALLARSAVLVDFQVSQPQIVPKHTKECTIKVLERDFAFSYGSPEIVEFAPPTDCGDLGSWAAITLNFTVTSNGTQYDRLGIFTFKNVEIWRTSTPEPTRGDGIIWTYIKDVTRYTPLFAKPGTFILELDNLIQTGLDGIYSTVLHATFYASSPLNPRAPKADLIVPLSTLLNTTGDDASVPPEFSINVTLPRNTIEVYAELFASGNGEEEAWYGNIENKFVSKVPQDFTYGFGPFREVRFLIDGQVTGTVFPYAVIFTGGYVPSVWRPITAYGALDLPTYFLDLTPWVPLLTDGQAHTFTIDVVSAEEDHGINANWYVSGLLQVVTDASSKPTTGNILSYAADPYAKSTVVSHTRGNGDIDVTVTASRRIHVESTITAGSGRTTQAVWSQDMQYSNHYTLLNNGTRQILNQVATGTMTSTHNGKEAVGDKFSYPITIDYTWLNENGTLWNFTIDHSYARAVNPNPFVLSSIINNHQVGGGFYDITTSAHVGNGTNNNSFSYVDAAGNTYNWRVNAALNNITLDRQSGSLA